MRGFTDLYLKPDFPIVQIKESDWNKEIMMELFRFDEFYYSGDSKIYFSHMYGKRFLDSLGRIFTASKLVRVDTFLAKLGLGKKYEIIFSYTGITWNYSEAKRFILSRIHQLPSGDSKNEWIKSVENATTIKQLIEAER